MTNARMLIVNDFDDAELSLIAGGEVGSLPLSHLQVYSNSRHYRSTNTNEVQLTLTWQQPRILSGCALRRHNMSSSSTWRIEVFKDTALTDVGYDSNNLWPTGKPAIEQKTLGELEWLVDPLVAKAVDAKYQDSDIWFDTQLAHGVRITLNDPDNVPGFIDLSRIYIGRALQPRVNFSYGHTMGWLANPNKKKRSMGGTAFGKKAAKPRELKFALKHLNEQDRPHFVNAINLLDETTDWYVSMFPGAGGQKERHYAMACQFEVLPKFEGNFYNNFLSDYHLVEA